MSSRQQAGAGRDALNLQTAESERNRYMLEPFNRMGMYGASALNQGLGIDASGQFNPNAPLTKQFTLADFQASPAYQFNLQQGQDALNKSAAARGNLYAPQTLQDLSKYTQGMASNEFQNALGNFRNWQGDVAGRLSGVAGMGLSAGSALAGVGTNMAGMMGNTMQGIGNARAAGTMGGINALAGGLGDAYNNYMQNQILGQQQQSLFGGGGGGNYSIQG
jgi:hypothetical protein